MDKNKIKKTVQIVGLSGAHLLHGQVNVISTFLFSWCSIWPGSGDQQINPALKIVSR